MHCERCGRVLRIGWRFACPFFAPIRGGHLTDLCRAGTPIVGSAAPGRADLSTVSCELTVLCSPRSSRQTKHSASRVPHLGKKRLGAARSPVHAASMLRCRLTLPLGALPILLALQANSEHQDGNVDPGPAEGPDGQPLRVGLHGHGARRAPRQTQWRANSAVSHLPYPPDSNDDLSF